MKVTFFCNTQACLADSIDEGFFGQLKLGSSKLLFGGHSGITLQCSLCPNGHLPIANAQNNLYCISYQFIYLNETLWYDAY